MNELVTYVLIGVGIIFVAGALYFVTKNDAVTAEEKQLGFIEQYEVNKNAILIDVRTKDEYNGGHIPEALNIDFYASDFLSQVQTVAEGKDVYLYCRSGSRSAQARLLLEKNGFTVTDLAGGIAQYSGTLKK